MERINVTRTANTNRRAVRARQSYTPNKYRDKDYPRARPAHVRGKFNGNYHCRDINKRGAIIYARSVSFLGEKQAPRNRVNYRVLRTAIEPPDHRGQRST